MAMRTARKPFADTAEPNGKVAGADRAQERRIASFSRLIRNADFREWMFATLFTLCGFENEMRDTTEFERGIRAAASLIRRELLIAEDAPEFFAALDKRYFDGVRRGIVDAIRKNTENEGIR